MHKSLTPQTNGDVDAELPPYRKQGPGGYVCFTLFLWQAAQWRRSSVRMLFTSQVFLMMSQRKSLLSCLAQLVSSRY